MTATPGKLTYNDKQHAYWVDGKRCKGVTSVAKYPEDGYLLGKWRDRQIVIGMAASPPLVHRAAAHFDERDKIEDIAEEAMVIAKAHEASGRGTADHRIIERVDLGLDIIETPEAKAVANAWLGALKYLNVEIVPELIERIVVYPDQLIAGRFDRIARYRETGRLVMLDVKTGENAVKYPHSTAIQLGLYTNAPYMAGPLEPTTDGGGYSDRFEPMPDMHLDHAIVVYLPPEGAARCFRVNIAAGFEAARDICFPTVTWRKRDDLVEEITEFKVTNTDPEQAYIALLERTEWVRDRVEAIKTAGHAPLLAAQWSLHPEIPTFPRGGPRTVDELNKVVDMCETVEKETGLPFGATDPSLPPATKATTRDRSVANA